MSSFTNDPKKMNRKEEEIYNILYQKKEINDKTPKFRTEDEKKKLKSLIYIIYSHLQNSFWQTIQGTNVLIHHGIACK